MKNSKKIALVALILIILAVLCFTFVACDSGNDDSEKSITVYIGDGENNSYSVTTNQAYLMDVLKEMKNNGIIDVLETEDSAYGAFIKSIGSLNPGANEFCSVWHSLDKFELKSVYADYYASYEHGQKIEEEGTVFFGTKIGNKTLYLSTVGVSSLPVKDGACYAIFVDRY